MPFLLGGVTGRHCGGMAVLRASNCRMAGEGAATPWPPFASQAAPPPSQGEHSAQTYLLQANGRLTVDGETGLEVAAGRPNIKTVLSEAAAACTSGTVGVYLAGERGRHTILLAALQRVTHLTLRCWCECGCLLLHK